MLVLKRSSFCVTLHVDIEKLYMSVSGPLITQSMVLPRENFTTAPLNQVGKWKPALKVLPSTTY